MARALLFSLMLLFPGSGMAIAEARSAAPEEVTITELGGEDSYYIHGDFTTDVDPGQVWRVLSDYEGLKGVLSSLQSSKVLSRTAEVVSLEQVMDGQFLFFHKGVRLFLDVKEQAPWRIDFNESQGRPRPFRHYQGSWQLEPAGAGCRVDYTLAVSRGDMAPLFLERKLFRDNSRGLLHELRAEVSRRAGQAPSSAPAVPVGNGL